MSQEYEDISRESGHVITLLGRRVTFMATLPSAEPASSFFMRYRIGHVGDVRKSNRLRPYHEIGRLNRVTGIVLGYRDVCAASSLSGRLSMRCR